METLHTLKWGNPEIDKISHLKSNRSSSGICVALLSRLSGLQTVTDQLHLLLGFPNDVRDKYLAFSTLGPIERGTALAAI
jgi:hypothetical protein